MTQNAERATWEGSTEPQKDMYDPAQADALRAEKVAAQLQKGIKPAVPDQQLVLPDPRWASLNPKEIYE